jgi:hypothetical protein
MTNKSWPAIKKKNLIGQRERTHLLVKELADIEKKVAPDWCATAFPMSVFPVPGGPNNKIPTYTTVAHLNLTYHENTTVYKNKTFR